MRVPARACVCARRIAFPLGGEFDNVEVPLYLSVGSKKQLQ